MQVTLSFCCTAYEYIFNAPMPKNMSFQEAAQKARAKNPAIFTDLLNNKISHEKIQEKKAKRNTNKVSCFSCSEPINEKNQTITAGDLNCCAKCFNNL
jgi:hypothetical protein